MQCNAMRCDTIRYDTMQCNAIQYSTVQYSTVQYIDSLLMVLYNGWNWLRRQTLSNKTYEHISRNIEI